MPQGWGVLCAMAAASLCVRSDLSNASPVQGARGAPLLCGGGKCRRVRVRCVVLAMMMCGNVTTGTRANNLSCVLLCACAFCVFSDRDVNSWVACWTFYLLTPGRGMPGT